MRSVKKYILKKPAKAINIMRIKFDRKYSRMMQFKIKIKNDPQ
jgi:hypothetical protein